MLQQSGQIPLGVFDKNPHQNLPGSLTAGQLHCAVCADKRIKSHHSLYLERSYVEALLDYTLQMILSQLCVDGYN